MAHWFGHNDSHRFVSGGSMNSHELDYGDFFTAYIKDKQRNIDRQRHQAAKLSSQIKKDQARGQH